MVDIFVGFFGSHVEHVIDRNVTDQLAVVVYDRHRGQIVLAEEVNDDFLILFDRHLGRHGLHQIRDQFLRRGNQQSMRQNSARQAAVAISCVDLEYFTVYVRAAEVLDRLADRVELGHTEHVGIHQPAGCGLVVLEKLLDLFGFLDRQPFQKLVGLFGGEFTDHVGRVVRRHLRDHLGQAIAGKVIHDFVAHPLIEQRDQLRSGGALQGENHA